jgi:hypothetical protein
MLDAPSMAAAAVRLLLLAMTPRIVPANNAEYGELLRRYASDINFRDLTKAIARGMELQIYGDSTVHGLMLVSQPDGFFAPSLDSFRRNMSFRERVAYGLLHFVLAAYVYPSEDRLNDEDDVLSHKVRAADVARYSVEVCEGLRAMSQAGEIFSEQCVEGYNHLLSLPETDSSGGRQNLIAMTRYIMEKYAREGLFQEFEEGGEALFRARPQFRVQVRFMIRETDERLFRQMQDFATKHETAVLKETS